MAKKTQHPLEIGTLDPEYGLTVQELRDELELGVVEDKLDDGKLLRLFAAGVLLVIVMIFAAYEMYRYFDFKASYKAAVETVYPDIQNLKASHRSELTTAGVIDADKGVYRIPVDSAFTLLLNERKN